MHVSIHKGESQDNDFMLFGQDVNPVHSVDEIFFINENGINGITVGAEMPTVLDGYIPALYKRSVQSQIRYDLTEQTVIYLHLQSSASSGCSRTKV